MAKLQTISCRLASDRTGTVAMEYAAVGALIAIAALGAILRLAGEVKKVFQSSDTAWEQAVSSDVRPPS